MVSWIDGFGLYLTSPTVALILSLISSTVASNSKTSLDLCPDILSCKKMGCSHSVSALSTTILSCYLFVTTIWRTDFVIMLPRWCVGPLYAAGQGQRGRCISSPPAPLPSAGFLRCNATMAVTKQCEKQTSVTRGTWDPGSQALWVLLGTFPEDNAKTSTPKQCFRI